MHGVGCGYGSFLQHPLHDIDYHFLPSLPSYLKRHERRRRFLMHALSWVWLRFIPAAPNSMHRKSSSFFLKTCVLFRRGGLKRLEACIELGVVTVHSCSTRSMTSIFFLPPLSLLLLKDKMLTRITTRNFMLLSSLTVD